MLMYLRKYNRSVIVTWLVSYVAVLTVPIVVSFALYMVSYQQVKSESTRANELLLEQMEMSIDSKLKGLKQLSLEIALNKNISSFSSVDLPLKNSNYYELFLISESLRTYKNANDYIDQIYVMYNNSDTVISTFDHTNRHGLYQKLRQEEQTSYEQWNELFERKYVNSYTPMKFKEEGQSHPVVVFAHSLVFNTPGQPPATVLFLIRDSKLMEGVPQQKEASMFILDKQNRSIASSPHIGGLLEHVTYEQLPDEQGIIYKEVDHNHSAVSYITSKITGWKYVSVLPAALFNKKMETMRKLTWLSILLCLFLGGLLSFIFLRKNYFPIQVMLQGLSQKFGVRFDGGSNEYSFMEGAIQHYFAEKEDMLIAFNRHRSTIRSHFLRRLLKGYSEKKVPLQDALFAHDITFQSDRYAVFLIFIDHYGKFQYFESSEDVPDQKQQMMEFILTNVLEDAASDNAVIYTVEMNDLLACIVNFKDSMVRNQESLIMKEIAYKTSDFMKEYFQSELTIAAGEVNSGVEGISQSYSEALDALEYRVVLGCGHYIRYADTSTSTNAKSNRYYYPLNMEQQLIYAVKSGNYCKAESLLEEVFKENFSVHPVSVPLAKCLMYNLTSTLLHTLDEVSTGSKRTWDAHLMEVEYLLDCDHVMQMKEKMKQKLRQVCDWIQAEKRDYHRYLIDDVQRYIEQHLCDPTLNISMIGEAFRMTPSYLSRLYKEHTGEALLDTINRSRLSEAKGLLARQKLTVNEIAGRVGYADVSTFLRIFKKFEGMTPGKYQKAAQ